MRSLLTQIPEVRCRQGTIVWLRVPRSKLWDSRLATESQRTANATCAVRAQDFELVAGQDQKLGWKEGKVLLESALPEHAVAVAIQ